MRVYFFQDTPGLFYDTSECKFMVSDVSRFNNSRSGVPVTDIEILRYLKNKFTNYNRFIAGFIDPIRKQIANCGKPDLMQSVVDVLDEFQNQYDAIAPYSYREAFSITNDLFRAIVFGTIRVPDMIKELGHRRIAVAGQPVKHKQFSKSGEFLGYAEYDVVFETHWVDGSKLGLNSAVYAVRCWCTTTENEHWLWIDERYKDDPLEAISRTFFVHENLIPHIKELKRQGDILLVELTNDIEPRGHLVSLSKEQYFGLLTAQS